jgi:hypothetical protein
MRPMTTRLTTALLLLLLPLIHCAPDTPDPAPAPGARPNGCTKARLTTKPFTVFAANKCFDELAMGKHGIERNILLSESGFFAAGEDHSGPADGPTVERQYQRQRNATDPIVIDIESWGLPDGFAAGTSTPAAIVLQQKKYLDVLAVFDQSPNLHVGYYGEVPVRNYWTPVKYRKNPDNGETQSSYRAWQAANDFFAPIAARVDALYPSLYTFYEEPADWTFYAEEMVKEAYRVSKNQKKVYPYLWPRLHTDKTLQTFVSGSLWKTELETLYRMADGVVIWNISRDSCAELAASDWWKETTAFLDRITAEEPPPPPSSGPPPAEPSPPSTSQPPAPGGDVAGTATPVGGTPNPAPVDPCPPQ